MLNESSSIIICSLLNSDTDEGNKSAVKSLFHIHLPPKNCTQIYNNAALICLSFILSILSIGTIINNCLMIIAVGLVKKLQTPCNMLILNLAVTDLFVGIFVIPFASVYQIIGVWIFSEFMCDLFILFDVLLCTSSILNLCAISVDRYLVITKPFTYGVNRSRSMMLFMIMIVWTASGLISIPPLFGWRQQRKPFSCEYSDDLGYQIYATFIAFYVPLVIMLVLYGRIFRLASAMMAAETKLRMTTTALLNATNTSDNNSDVYNQHNSSRRNSYSLDNQLSNRQNLLADWLQPVTRKLNRLSHNNSNYEHKYSMASSCDNEQINLMSSMKMQTSPTKTSELSTDDTNRLVSPSNSNNKFINNNNSIPAIQIVPAINDNEEFIVKTTVPHLSPSRKSSYTPSILNFSFHNNNNEHHSKSNANNNNKAASKEVKAVRTLGIIMGCFVICWLPFFLVQLFSPLFRWMGIVIENPIASTLFQIFYWLGYTNSFLNPLIYAKFNREFRQPFLQILQCHCRKINSHLRYQDYSNYATPGGHHHPAGNFPSRRPSTSSYCSTAAGPLTRQQRNLANRYKSPPSPTQ